MFSLYIPNKLRIITIKFVKNIRNAFTVGLFHSFVLFKRNGVLLSFIYTLFVAHAFDVGIVVFSFHHKLVQSLSYDQCIGVSTIEPPVLAAFKACNEQQELDHLQCLVVCVYVTSKVIDLLLAKLVIRYAKEHKHTL